MRQTPSACRSSIDAFVEIGRERAHVITRSSAHAISGPSGADGGDIQDMLVFHFAGNFVSFGNETVEGGTLYPPQMLAEFFEHPIEARDLGLRLPGPNSICAQSIRVSSSATLTFRASFICGPTWN